MSLPCIWSGIWSQKTSKCSKKIRYCIRTNQTAHTIQPISTHPLAIISNRCLLPPSSLTFINSKSTRKSFFYCHFLYNFLSFNYSHSVQENVRFSWFFSYTVNEKSIAAPQWKKKHSSPIWMGGRGRGERLREFEKIYANTFGLALINFSVTLLIFLFPLLGNVQLFISYGTSNIVTK